MDRKELARFGIPFLGFGAYVKWGGVPLAAAFALILFGVISGLINWHRTDPRGFFRGMRVWVVILVLIPGILLTLGALGSSPILAIPALALVAGAIWLVVWAGRHANGTSASGVRSMATQNLEAANALTDTIRESGRRSQNRGAMLHAQSENVDLIRQKRELEAQNAALQQRVESLEREAKLPPDPFAEPSRESRG